MKWKSAIRSLPRPKGISRRRGGGEGCAQGFTCLTCLNTLHVGSFDEMEVSYSLAAETKGNIPEEGGGGGGEGCGQGFPLSARARHRELNMRPSHNKNEL